jgi:hypothetical protein
MTLAENNILPYETIVKKFMISKLKTLNATEVEVKKSKVIMIFS